MNETVVIVGSGSTAISFLYNYLQQLDEGKVLPRTIYLFEKRDVFGSGAAYAPDVVSNILNTKTGYITPYHDKPGDFFHWLQINKASWSKLFPSLKLDEHSYSPRPLFGLYLCSQLAWLVKEAAARQVNVIQLHSEVVDVFRHDHKYVVKTECNLELKVDYVFFFCGTLPAKTNASVGDSPFVLPTPYPVSGLPHKIPAKAVVAILGHV